jgi:hypothetical protein
LLLQKGAKAFKQEERTRREFPLTVTTNAKHKSTDRIADMQKLARSKARKAQGAVCLA